MGGIYMKQLTVGLAIILSGCTTSKVAMDAWLGHREAELVSRWGVPHYSMYTLDGQHVLTWQTNWGQSGQHICRRTFTADSYGTVVSWGNSGCVW